MDWQLVASYFSVKSTVIFYSVESDFLIYKVRTEIFEAGYVRQSEWVVPLNRRRGGFITG